MILNLSDNGKILKQNYNLRISDFTVLTGENGSGKTQLLEFIHNHAGGIEQYDELGNPIYDENTQYQSIIFPITNEAHEHIKDVVYSYPGLRASPHEPDFSSHPLLAMIKQQWQEVEPFVAAYSVIRHRSFSNDDIEMSELNAALARIIASGLQTSSQRSQVTAKTISENQFRQLKDLSMSSGKGIHDLNLIDFIIFYKIPLNIFSAALDLLFHQFHLKKKYYSHLTEKVAPPWIVFNEILDRAKFRYTTQYTESQSEESPIPILLFDKKSGKSIDFHSLSSGETTIMALIFALFNSSNNGHFPEVILFDEPDAHLHPSLTQIFLDVIQDVLVKRHHVKIILTTHSPSTVALAPDKSIYCMDRELGMPIKMDKRSALNILSSGLASMTIEESDLGINYNVQKAKKHVLFTEGITDKINLEIAWDKLYPGTERNFYIQDCFCASVLGNLFSRGADQPDGIFHQFPDRKLIALFDFDYAGYNEWNKKNTVWPQVESDPTKGLTRRNSKCGNGYLVLLPVPKIPEINRQVIFNANETFGNKSNLTIEGMLMDNMSMQNYFKRETAPGGGTIKLFNESKDKRDFSNELRHLDAAAFIHFKPLFTKIEELISLS